MSFIPGSTPPSFLSQPASQTNVAGANVSFSPVSIGTPPINYQWYFKGLPIPGAKGSSLTLNDIQAGNDGDYHVIATSDYGTATSSNASLTVLPSAPKITSHPSGGSVLQGSSFTFTAAATGTAPIKYRWLFNNNVLAGATNASLTLSNVQAGAAGNYALVASNSIGTVVSSAVITMSNRMFRPVSQTWWQLQLPETLRWP